MWIIIAILLFTAELLWDVYTDLKKTQIDHTKEEKLRGLLLFPSIVCFAVPLNWYFWLIPLFLEETWYWMLFDGLYGIGKKKGWWWTGTEDGQQDAHSDNFLQRLPRWAHISIKTGLIITTTIGYLLALKYSK